MQATMWEDKKVVGFLDNHLVIGNADEYVERWSPRPKKRVSSHEVTRDYALHMNGVPQHS